MNNPSVFKYFGNQKHLESFVNKGEVMFNTLSYFLSCDDKARRDLFEGSNVYSPSDGLSVTVTETQQKFIDSRALISKIKNPHRVFVFCTSTERSDTLYKKFGSIGCVEIFNLDEFKKKIIRKIQNPAHNIKNKELLANAVNYYDFKNELNTRHACPDQIIMSKSAGFSEEKEFRFAFAKDKNCFDVNNVDYSLSHRIIPPNLIGSGKKLILGDLTDIVRVIYKSR